METLAMTAHEENLIRSIVRRIRIQRVHHMSESLPLCSIAAVRFGVSLVKQAEVHCSLR